MEGFTEDEKRVVPEVQDLGSSPDASLSDEKRGTDADQLDMFRMGKTQEMRRNFRAFSMFGFAMVLMCSWEVALSVATIALTNGGTAGFIWMFFVIAIGFVATNASMAEMGSMAPTSGGQYHWVSEFSPRQFQRSLSYLMGWMCTLGWQTGATNTALLSGLQIQGLAVLNYPDYVPRRWHSTLIAMAVGGFSCLVNTVFARWIPTIERACLGIHCAGFVAILATLWATTPEKADASAVFGEFYNGGWPTVGVSTLIGGTLASIIPLLGADCAVHLSEELRDAARAIPTAMILSTVLNATLGWIMIITLCFNIGDLTQAISSPTGFAYIEVFYASTGSRAGATVMGVVVQIMNIFCNMSINTTASRQLFAFARDDGVPFSGWLKRVPKGWDIPVNSVLVTYLITALLTLINIGNSAAFNSIASLSICAILGSYICCIGLVAWRRITNRPLLPSPFSLGRFGLLVNLFSLAFLVLVFFWSFWPGVPLPILTPALMNWNVVMFTAVAVWSFVYFWLIGRKVYKGPAAYVRRLE